MKTMSLKQVPIALLFLGVLMASCGKEYTIEPLEKSSTPPGPVTNIEVVNLPGKAWISYTLPDDQDLLYVKATYVMPSTGEVAEVKSSYYNNGLLVEGFAREEEHKVTLVAVNRSEVESEPVDVTIKPQPSPIFDVFKSIEVYRAYGGFDLLAENSTSEDIVIEILEENDLGELVINDNSVYTAQKNIIARIRDLDTVVYEFSFTVRDRWMNYSDTVVKHVKPKFEKLLDKNKYSALTLPGDAPPNPRCNGISGMWDNSYVDWPGVLQTTTDYTPTTPHVITFSVGQMAQVSRVKIWDYPEYDETGRPYYVSGALKEFEIWGCPTSANDLLPEVGTVDESNPWILLGTFTSVKPSGLPYGQMNEEDLQAAEAGFNWNCNTVDIPEVQYLRIRCLENYLGTTFMAIAEIQVYGGKKEE
jgi:hypothetical protein